MPTLKNKTAFLVNLATYLTKNDQPIIYVAGKVTGRPIHEYTKQFADAKAYLEFGGWKVLNPCDFIGPEESWETAMRMASTLLNMADSIYMLPGWEDIEGAKWELAQAVKFGLAAYHADPEVPASCMRIVE